MPRPRRKPFWRWTPLPWLIFVILVFATASFHDLRLEAPYLVLTVLTIVFAVAFVVSIVVVQRQSGPNFTAEGRLRRLEGLELIEVPAAGHPLTVYGVERHQGSIAAAQAVTRGDPRALVVPDVGDAWSLRSDIAIYLISGSRFYLIGRLGEQAQVSWQHAFDELRAAGRYIVAPAEVIGSGPHGLDRPFKVDVRLEGALA